jgi:hypothetical protein
VTSVTVHFLDEAVADHLDTCLDRGLVPERCFRIWIHTHPGASAEPTGTDEATFERCFGSCHWAVMMILARSGQTSARLAYNVGPQTEMEIPVQIDWSDWPAALANKESLDAQINQWRAEFDANVHCPPPQVKTVGGMENGPWFLQPETYETEYFDEEFWHEFSNPFRTAGPGPASA